MLSLQIGRCVREILFCHALQMPASQGSSGEKFILPHDGIHAGAGGIQKKMPPGTSEQLHFHQHAQQLFYVLSDIATFEIDGQVIVINAKESIHIPKITKHCIAKKGNEDLEFLVISEPKSHSDRQNL